MTRSCLYECRVTHERSSDVRRRFSYRVFAFALDPAEIDALAARIPWLSRNRFNLYSFFDRDHADPLRLLRDAGISATPARILLVTNLRLAGYVFNPVSFFFCFDDDGKPLAAIAEVNNTFGERKAYVLGAEAFDGAKFEAVRPKHFYISPFLELDVDLRLRLAPPGEQFGVVIDDLRDGALVFHATMTGRRAELTAARLLWFAVKYPFLTVRIIAAIHWQALRLWLRGVPHHRKRDRPELQTGLIGGEKA